MSKTFNPVSLLAATIIREAAAEPEYGQIAVGVVIRNRVNHPRWWGDTWESVILKPWQFSCWNFATVEGGGVDAVAEKINAYQKRGTWSHFADIASRLYSDAIPDELALADHYYNPTIASPSWGAGKVVCDINNHRFLRLEL